MRIGLFKSHKGAEVSRPAAPSGPAASPQVSSGRAIPSVRDAGSFGAPAAKRPLTLAPELSEPNEAYLARARELGDVHGQLTVDEARSEFRQLAEGNAKATPETLHANDERLLSLAQRIFAAEGVTVSPCEFQGHPALKIEGNPEGQGLAKTASTTARRFGTALVYCPGALTSASTGAQAFVSAGVVNVGHDLVLDGRSNASLVHELRHVADLKEVGQGRAMPFDGTAMALGREPLPGGVADYAGSFGFDELSAYSSESAFLGGKMHKLVSASPEERAQPGYADALRRHVFDLLSNANLGRATGEQATQLAASARGALKSKAPPQLAVVDGKAGPLRTANVACGSFFVQVPIAGSELEKTYDRAQAGDRGAMRDLCAHLDRHFARLERLGEIQRDGQGRVHREILSITGPADSKEHLEQVIALMHETRAAFLKASRAG